MKNKILIIIIILLVIVLAVLIGMNVLDLNKITNEDSETVATTDTPVEEAEEEEEIKIWSGDSRSVAVVIDNVGDARPQTGLNEAAIVYEVTVEGGLTRLFAIYKNVEDMDMTIAPVRSARPVFIDYAIENDSIFVHYGYSALAKTEIEELNIDNVNGLVVDTVFWRTSEKSAPHNVLTTLAKVMEYAEQKGYETTSDEDSVLNYVTDEVTLEDGDDATTVTIPYTSSYKVTFKYNEETQRYERYDNGTLQKDWLTGETFDTKNIIITFAYNYTTDEEVGAGRQKIVNIGDLDGYYITNGKAIKIICSKDSRNDQTVYKNAETGEEIEVNDGNTYIEIVPLNTNVRF